MNLFLKVHQSRRKKILNTEVVLVLKHYLFIRVSTDKFQPPIISPFIDKKMDGVSNFFKQPSFYVLRMSHLQRITTKNP